MMNDSVNPNHMGDGSVASTRMTTQSSPPSLALKTAHRTSLGHRLQRALTGGPNRRFTGLHSPLGFASPIVALLALLTASLLFLLPGAPLHAQDSSTIQYPENGEDAVATFTGADPEMAGAITWSLKADANGVVEDDEDFEIDKSSGELSFMKSPNYEMATGGGADGSSSTYTVTVVATDADGQTNDKAVTIEVTNVDEPGSVTLDKLAPYPGVLLTATHTDPDMGLSNHEWQWSRSRSENGSYANIEGAKAETYNPTSGDVGYFLRARVSYDDGEGDGKTARVNSTHEVQGVNVPNTAPAFPDQDPETPEVEATATRMIGENADAGASVGAPVTAEDKESDILTYTLTTLTGAVAPPFEIDPATGQITVEDGADVDFEGAETYTVTVVSTDPAGESAEIVVTINVVNDVNEPPAITGTVQDSYVENATNQVVVFTATNPDPDMNTAGGITWSLSGPDAGDFDITSDGLNGTLRFKASPNYESPADADGDNEYEVTVSATDADSNRGEESVKIKVANVEEAGTVTLSAVQARVGVSLTASLTDIDGPVSGVTWQWKNGVTPIEGATSDTYTPTSEDDGALTVEASYTDPEDSNKTATSPALTVAADTRNKAPAFDADQDPDTEGDQAEAERTIAENSAEDTALNGGEVVATDPNADDELTYTLGGPDASSFAISSADPEGQITVGAGTKLDFETKATYMVTVIATDSFGATASIDVTIKVTDENEGPAITGPAEVEFAENGTGRVTTFTGTDPEMAGAITWSLKADANGVVEDDEDFEIDKSSGELSFKESPNYEASMGGGDAGSSSTYTVTVVATDADAMMNEKTVTIEVTNMDEAGKVSLDKMAPYPGEVVTASLSDPDMGLSNHEWQWSRSRSENGSYANIEGAKAETYNPTSGDVGYFLRARVSYDDGEGDGKTARVNSTHEVQGVNVPNTAPAFPDQDPETPEVEATATRMIGENADAGASVGAPVTAEDKESDILTYTLTTLTGAVAPPFEIDPATGQITVEDGADVDFEGAETYTVTVVSTDPAGESAEIVVTINVVNDVNEPPAITGTVQDSYVENATNQVVVFTATNPDPDMNTAGGITWSLSGPDAGDFDITSDGLNGTLRFKASPNYESPADADGDNEYEVTVSATDADSNRGEESVKIKVANVEEAGTVTLSAVQARVGVSLTASLTDIDGPVSGVTWQWKNDGADIKGATSDTYTPTSEDGGALTVEASYTDPEDSNKTATSPALTVAADTRNKAPAFDADQDLDTEGDQAEAERTIAEDASAGASVGGGPVIATDPNGGDQLTYTLSGPDASSFDVSSGGCNRGADHGWRRDEAGL